MPNAFFLPPTVRCMSDLSRYHRQMLLPGMGEAQQQRLLDSHAMLIGCGALGCTIADLLVRAGVGRLSIIDRDVVETTNLQRQTLFDERDAREGLPKAEAAKRRLSAVNSGVVIEAIVDDFGPGNAEQMVRPHPVPGVLVDGTDNFETRYLLNDVAVKHGIPYVYGGAVGTTGMSMTIVPRIGVDSGSPSGSACLRCLFPDPPAPGTSPTCDTAGILATASTIVAAAQATDVIKVLLGRFDLLSGTLLSFDLWANQRRRIDLANARRADCVCCGKREFEFLAGAGAGSTRVLCGRNSVQVSGGGGGGDQHIDLAGLASRLSRHGDFVAGEYVLRGKLRDPAGIELTVFPDGRAIIGGTSDATTAKSLYARFIGA